MKDHVCKIEQKKFLSTSGNLRAHCTGCRFRGPWRNTKGRVIADMGVHHEALRERASKRRRGTP